MVVVYRRSLVFAVASQLIRRDDDRACPLGYLDALAEMIVVPVRNQYEICRGLFGSDRRWGEPFLSLKEWVQKEAHRLPLDQQARTTIECELYLASFVVEVSSSPLSAYLCL
jgi:hypothetical protein